MTTKHRLATWYDAIQVLADWRVLRMGLLGFSSGLPLLLVFGTLSLWLREAGIDRTLIGFISWVALLYGLKVLWSPLVDHLRIPLLTPHMGRRRAWLLLSQVGVMIGLVGMAITDPSVHLGLFVGLALWVAFSSATQDIVVDAYRIEIAELRLQGLMAGVYTTGYRLAMFTASAGALWIAAFFDPDEAIYQHWPWLITYLVMAGLMLVGLMTTLFSPEPRHAELDQSLSKPHWQTWLKTAIYQPFTDFIQRYAWLALLVLALVASYRTSDIVLGVIANVFYTDMGFSKNEIALVSKGFGIYMTILGALLGGVAVYRIGIMRMLLIGAILAASTNLLFAWLATSGNDFWLLVAVVGMDNLSAGIASAAFIAYLSGLTNVAYSATQYALFSSLMLLLPKFLGGFSGALVDTLGYEQFFILTALLGVPVILLILMAWRYTDVELPPRS